jgi:hypothetical protein
MSTTRQALFQSILPEDIVWKPFPAFPSSVRLAVVVGQPSEPGSYVVRVKVPTGVKLMPHKHPEDRVYTVMSGVFYIGLGDWFDADGLKAYPQRPCAAGRYLPLPLGQIGGVHHPSDGNRPPGPRIPEPEGRSAQPRLERERPTMAA